MRYVGALAILVGAGCSGETHAPPSPETHPVAPFVALPGPACGDRDALPSGVTREEGALVVACDGDATRLAISAYEDGLVRLRWGAKGPDALVPVSPGQKLAPKAGTRNDSLVVCTPFAELSIAPRACTVDVRDDSGAKLVEGARFLRDGEAKGVERTLAERERVYGLGLHTASKTGLDLRGTKVDLWNTDAYDDAHKGFPPNAPALYESIPFQIGLRDQRAFGLFFHDTHRLKIDIGATDASKLRVIGGGLDQYLVLGPSMRDVLRRYTRLTGRIPLPAPWAIGFHQSRWEGPCDGAPKERPFCSSAQVLELAKTYREKRIPADGLFLDIQHMRGFRTFTFDPERFASPEALFSELRKLGFRAHVIVDPGIKVDDAWDVYRSGVDGGHFLLGKDGKPWIGEVWPGPSAFPDFSGKKTRAWWSGLVAGLVDKGVHGAWIDMNEPASFGTGTVPNDLACDGDGRPTTMAELHNAYAFFEAAATYEGMKNAAPSERPFVLTRAAFAGSQRFAAAWTGDAPSTWTTLSMTLPMLLQLGLSGMTFSGSDVGGYSGREESTGELFSRWMALGAVSPFFRAHAEKDARRQEPWAFGTEVEEASRALVSLRYELAPYLYSTFHEAHETGAPVLRPLVFDHQDDERTHGIGDQAMLGSSLLVAPVLEKGSKGRTLYLPKGRWFELHSGASFEGGTVSIDTSPEPFPLDALPIFARAGAIVPRTVPMAHAGAIAAPPLFVDVYPGSGSFTLYEDDGRLEPQWSKTRFEWSGTKLIAKREGSFVAPHERVVVRFLRVDRAPKRVVLDGVPTTAFSWDENARTLRVETKGTVFSIELDRDATLDAEGDVDVPLRVALPPGTPASTSIHVASSVSGWTHQPLVRSGDVATGKLRVPRGKYVFYKITRGDWSTVEKGPSCAERSNRSALGAPAPVEIAVVAWADRCP